MSAVVLNGRPFVAGLIWMARGGAWTLSANARKHHRPYYVHWRRQTGLAPAAGVDLVGMPSLSAALLRRIGEVDPQSGVAVENWMALIEGENKRFALIKVRDGEVLADGEALFEDREAAVTAFKGQRSFGFSALYATPGLIADARDIDVKALPVEPDMALERAPFGRFYGARAAVVLAVLGGALAAALWTTMNWDTVSMWVAGRPAATTEAPVAKAEEMVPAVVASTALIEACARGYAAHPPLLPGWRVERFFCEARLSDRTFVEWQPALAGEAVMAAKWRLLPGHDAPLNRQLMERYLSRAGSGKAAVLHDSTAVAIARLGPVFKEASAAAPAIIALRRAIDIELGRRGVELTYTDGESARFTIVAQARQGLEELAALVKRVEGFEVTRLEYADDGMWRITGRAAEPEGMTAAQFNAVVVK